MIDSSFYEDCVAVGKNSRQMIKQPPHQHNVFATPDILVAILRPLIDGDFLPTLQSLSTVSKSFRQATKSNELWREICYQRWKGKWGFHPRWDKAMMDYSKSLKEQKQEQESTNATNNFWEDRYFFEEGDATRYLILAEELVLLTFDFRFWIGQPEVVGRRVVVKSGLLESASSEVRFSRPSQFGVGEGSEEEDDIIRPSWSARGHLTGHPCKEPGIEWFLDECRGVVQWGFAPNLWPQGSVQRLDNWGWQIRNPNVVLRSIDTKPLSPSKITSESSKSSKSKVDEIEKECSENCGKFGSHDHLWEDLLESLENVPLRNAPSVNGFPVTADIPRAFIEHYE